MCTCTTTGEGENTRQFEGGFQIAQAFLSLFWNPRKWGLPSPTRPSIDLLWFDTLWSIRPHIFLTTSQYWKDQLPDGRGEHEELPSRASKALVGSAVDPHQGILERRYLNGKKKSERRAREGCVGLPHTKPHHAAAATWNTQHVASPTSPHHHLHLDHHKRCVHHNYLQTNHYNDYHQTPITQCSQNSGQQPTTVTM